MKLENQVCTLDQAKRLKELGVIQKSLFIHKLYFESPVFSKIHVPQPEDLSAFTVAELGVMLQKGESGIPFYEDKIEPTSETFITISIETWITPNLFNCAIVNKEFSDRVYKECKSMNEAKARAAMLIYLLENNLTTADEVNERLNQN